MEYDASGHLKSARLDKLLVSSVASVSLAGISGLVYPLSPVWGTAFALGSGGGAVYTLHTAWPGR